MAEGIVPQQITSSTTLEWNGMGVLRVEHGKLVDLNQIQRRRNRNEPFASPLQRIGMEGETEGRDTRRGKWRLLDCIVMMFIG